VLASTIASPGIQHIKFRTAFSRRPPEARDSDDVSPETSQVPRSHSANSPRERQVASAGEARILSIRSQQQKRVPVHWRRLPERRRDTEHADSKLRPGDGIQIIMRSRCQLYDRGIKGIRSALRITGVCA
jgi:hypothetical protein